MMTKKMLWDLFKCTGKIEYYIKYKKWDEIVEQNKNGSNL